LTCRVGKFIRENPKCNIAPDSGTYLHSRMYTVQFI
jgi:hypothetical protein